MNTELKVKWVAALRSSKYQQTMGQLATDDGAKFCCLGVLCEVAGASYMPSAGLLPEDFRHSVGLSAWEETSLTKRNDGSGYPRHSFTEIADYIEANL